MKVLCIDLGSTYTKLTAIDLVKSQIIGSAKAYTTIDTHVLDGFYNALNSLPIGLSDTSSYDEIRAASSAAGGLKMIAVGLVPSLTATAAKLATNSAGAKLLKTYSYELSPQEAKEIKEAKPDILLLSGGIDGGNKDVILRNAHIISKIDDTFPVIVAGNKSVAEECASLLNSSQKPSQVVENVMPSLGVLNIEPAKSAIRELFIRRIISAKGLDDAQAIMKQEIIPTPLAVFNACELLSTLSELVAIDVGGATTDVYSMAHGSPTKPLSIQKGLVEPFAKRSVEGDLGVRYSIPSLVGEAGLEYIAQLAKLPTAQVSEWLEACTEDTSLVGQLDSPQAAIDEALASACTKLAMERHAGTLESVYTFSGEVFIQNGKDLSEIGMLIGSGGSIINSPNAEEILKHALQSPSDTHALKPTSPRIFIDRQNILTPAGLLSKTHPKEALSLMQRYIS